MIIDLIIWGVATIVAIAIVVGIIDSARGPSLRRKAAERRAAWEARQPEYLGPRRADEQDEWDDEL